MKMDFGNMKKKVKGGIWQAGSHRDDPDRRKKESGADPGSFRKFKK